MINHLCIAVADLETSKKFYEPVLASLGLAIISEFNGSVSFGVKEGTKENADPAGAFWLLRGVPASPRTHFAFDAASNSMVDSFYATGLAAGGTANGAPGYRAQYHRRYYAAFLLDPDGHNMEAVCHNGAGRS